MQTKEARKPQGFISKPMVTMLVCEWQTSFGKACGRYCYGMYGLKIHIGRVHRPEHRRVRYKDLTESQRRYYNQRNMESKNEKNKLH